MFDGAAELTDGTSTVDMGATVFGTAIQRTLTVTNSGIGNLSLTQLTQSSMPVGYRLVSGFGWV